ncbi:MAG: hypothetical protein V3575_05770 [Candidatus Absconditabacteria bacterium]
MIDFQINEIEKTKSDIGNLFSNNTYTAEKLLNILELALPGIYNQNTGVWENYTLREHTLMVLNQFDKYFGDKPLPGLIDKNLFRLLLGLHDIGKPFAISMGNKELQHYYNPIIIEKIFDNLGVDINHKRVSLLLSSNDTIGKLLQKKIDIKQAQLEFENNKIQSGMEKNDFFNIQLIYFMVDAGSYTVDAGGKYSLDRYFKFNPKIGIMILKPKFYNLIIQIKN